jgi:hypothetical protein
MLTPCRESCRKLADGSRVVAGSECRAAFEVDPLGPLLVSMLDFRMDA